MRNTYRGKTKKKCWIWMALGSALIIVVLFGFILFTKDEIKPVNASVTPFRSIVKSTETIELNAPKLSDVVLSEPQKKNTSYPLPDFDTLTPGVDYATDEVLVSFDGDLDELTEAMADVGAGDITVISDGIALVKTPDGASVETFSEELYNEDYSVSPNYTRGLEVTGTVTLPEGVGIESFDPEMARPNDAYAYSQWHLKEIGAYTAWDYTGGGYTSGSGVKVAIIDTGVYSAHPDLDDNIATDAVTYTSGGQTYVDAFPLSVVEDDNGVNTAEDDNGHGTHVAGIVAAEANNSLYISGVAPGASLYCIDVFGYHNGLFCAYTSDLIQAIDAAIAADVDIINMSLGGYGSPSVAEESKINEAVAAGIVVVAAAGNNNTSAAHYPSDYENVISVIATDFNNQKSSYSNYGSAKDIAAPGGGKVSNGTIQSYIWSTYLSPSNIVGMSGTSMAAPVVSGIVALMLDEDSSLSVSQVKERLYTTAVDVGTPGYDIYTGYGVANAEYVFTGGSDFVIENGVLTAYTGRSANVYIPTIVTKIGAHAFGGNAYVQSVVISDSVESIDTMAFANCVNLSSVEFGGGVASIGAQAFYGCVSLTQVNLPVSLTALASDAFRGCSALIAINMDEANIFFRGAGGVLYSKDGSQLVLYPEGKTDSYFSIPEGVVEISESAFYAAKISTISFPLSLVSIASRAFEKSELASVTIPASVSALGAAPFVGSQNLSAISVASGNTAFRSIEGLLYSADAGTLIEYPAAMSGTEYTVMDGTVAVAESAFEGVSSLTRIILPDSVQTLGKAAFANAAALTDVQFSPNITALPERVFAGTAFTHLDLPNTITTIGAEAFEGCGNLAQITLENNLTYADGSAFIGTAPGFTIYCYRLSYAETYAKTYGYAYSQMIVGVADVSLEAMENPVVYGAEGLTLTAQATPQEGHEGDTIPEYRFYYKRSSDSEWTPVKLAFSTENTIQFKPQTEGEYDFKVVVRNQGRTVIDGEDTLFGAILYSGNTPATYVQMDTMDGRGAFLSSEAIPLTISAADETYGQPLEYQVQYSYDGKRWRSTREWNGYQTFNADENDTVQMVYTLPNARERHYFIKVNIRGVGRTGVDQSAVVEIDAYTVMPLTSVALDTSDVLSVMTSEQGILLSAQASEQSGYEGNTPEYMFYYRTQGSSRWLKITGWTTNSTVTFVPKTEDVYYFRVEARAQGRKRADVYDNDSQAFALYYGSYPVKAVSNLTTSTKEFADNPISLSFDVQANFAEDTVEYRVLY
ncbi:MAG: S8 family serine peptidase, partial [Eubacteriales bacterium]